MAHPIVADQVECTLRRFVLALVDDDDLERERLAAEDRPDDRSRAGGPGSYDVFFPINVTETVGSVSPAALNLRAPGAPGRE